MSALRPLPCGVTPQGPQPTRSGSEASKAPLYGWPRSMRPGRSASIVGLWLVAVAPAHAQQPLPLELHWQAPVECPSAGEVRGELERIARVRPGFTLTALSAQAEVEHRGGGYALRLRTEHDGLAGERRLQAADCRALVRTLTLILALAFGTGVEVAAVTDDAAAKDASPTAGAARAPPAEQPAREAPSTETRAVEPAPRPAGSAARADTGSAPRLLLLLGGGAQLGLQPSATAFAAAGAELELAGGTFSVGARARAWPSVSQSLPQNVSARFHGLAGVLQGCTHLPLAAELALGLCGGGATAALRGRSSGASVSGSAVAPWYALLGATSLSWPRKHWLRVQLEASLAASLNRPRFVVDGLGPAYRVALFVPSLAALLVLAP
jgi:hypothetical protein